MLLRPAGSRILLALGALSVTASSPAAVAPERTELMRIVLPGRTVHNGNYKTAALLYELQTLLGGTARSPDVMKEPIVLRKGTDLHLDLSRVPSEKAALLRGIAAHRAPAGELGQDELEAWLQPRYYEMTRPYPSLEHLLREHPYRNNPDWLTVPVDAASESRRPARSATASTASITRGEPEPPVSSPVRGFFHRLPARVPQIQLGPEYYHMAFTELTEATARVKDGVFGVYGSLLLSELLGRKRLGTLTNSDRARYVRLQPH